MGDRIHVLAQQLFGKDSVEACNLQELEELAQRYPYFAPAQFLLLQKMKQENAPGYVQQLQKAVLYYHNPLEFEQFIHPARFETEFPVEEISPETSQEMLPQETAAESVPGSQPLSEEQFEQKEETHPSAELAQTDEVQHGDEHEEVNQAQQEEQIAEMNVPPLPQEPETVTIQETPPLPEEISDETGEGSVDETDETEAGVVDEQMQEKIEKVLSLEEQQIDEPAKSNALVFEPYHTVDYFASQGIKLSQAEVSSDKFGRQLKSFTEWLKTMKRLPASEVEKHIDNTSESKVQHLAQDSVHDASVVTEAMARVWIQQGNIEKAIETYNKLGLLNPSKKAYFAGLIENLKRS